MCKKDFKIRTLIKHWVIDEISNFHEIVPNFTYSKKGVILKYNWNFNF